MIATLRTSGQATPGTAAWSTAAFTPSLGALIVVLLFAVDGGGGDISGTLTISDGVNSYVSRVSQGRAGGFKTQGKCWTAVEGVGASRTITFDCGAATVQSAFWFVYEVTGQNTSPIGATASDAATFATDGAASLTLSSAPAATSLVLSGFGMDGDVTGTIAVTPGASWTEDGEVGNTTVAGYGQVQQRSGSISTSVDWVDVRAGTMATFSGCGIAIELTAAAAPPRLARILAPQQRMCA